VNCPKCGEDWSDVAVVRNAKREAHAATPALDVLVAASEALTKFEWGRNGQGVCSWCGWARGTYDSDAHGFDCPLAIVRAALATPAPLDVEARGGYLPLGTFSTDPPPMGEVLPIKVRPKVDMDATPAPLDVDAPDNANAAAASANATPAPLDVVGAARAVDGCIAIVQQSLDSIRAEDDGESRSIRRASQPASTSSGSSRATATRSSQPPTASPSPPPPPRWTDCVRR